MKEQVEDKFCKDVCDLIDLYCSDEQDRYEFIQTLAEFVNCWEQSHSITGAMWKEDTTALNAELQAEDKNLTEQYINNDEQ